MNPKLTAVFVAAIFVMLLGFGVFAAIYLGPFPVATSYWLGILLTLVGVACIVLRIIFGRDHIIFQRIGFGTKPATKNAVRDGILLILAGVTLVGIYYGDRYYESCMARVRFA